MMLFVFKYQLCTISCCKVLRVHGILSVSFLMSHVRINPSAFVSHLRVIIWIALDPDISAPVCLMDFDFGLCVLDLS